MAFWLSATVTLSAVDMRAFAAEFEADANGGIAIESDDESLSVTYEDLTYEDQIDALAETEDEQAEEWAEADGEENGDNSSGNAEKDLIESVFCVGGYNI